MVMSTKLVYLFTTLLLTLTATWDSTPNQGLRCSAGILSASRRDAGAKLVQPQIGGGTIIEVELDFAPAIPHNWYTWESSRTINSI
jgi:hypothetical protein